MANPQDLQNALWPACLVSIPNEETELHNILPRWSYSSVSMPFAVVSPSNVDHILSTVEYAISYRLKIVPTAGGHAPFVPITSDTIVLDMSHFNKIVLDKEEGEVRIGGGSTAGQVLKELAKDGFFTLTPNSNAVGMVGSILGTLSHPLNGLKGLGIDHVRSISIIPFSHPSSISRSSRSLEQEHTSALDKTEEVEADVESIPARKEIVLSPASQGDEKRLFNTLLGAGHGLGVITGFTLRAWPIASLNVTENKIWIRRLMFASQSIEAAANLYLALQPPPPPLNITLVFVRAPPTAPKSGMPMAMLQLSYFGPSEDAEKATAKSFEEQFTSKAISATTAPIDWAQLNDGVEVLNRHGGFRDFHSAFVKDVDGVSIIKAFETWKDFTEGDLKGRGMTYAIIVSWNTSVQTNDSGEEKEDESFFSARDRGLFVQAVPWYSNSVDRENAVAFGDGILRAIREKDNGEGRKRWGYANNFSVGQEANEVYAEKQIQGIESVKAVWDTQSVGWSPVTDGWQH